MSRKEEEKVQATITRIQFTEDHRPMFKWLNVHTGRWMREEITPEQYAALSTSIPSFSPSTFEGGTVAFQNLWIAGLAHAAVQSLFDTPGGNAFFGGAIDNGEDGCVIFLDDLENGGRLFLPRADYSGTFPNITATRPIPLQGVTVSGGIITKP